MKSFDEFLATLTEDVIAEIADNVQQQLDKMDAEDFEHKFGTKLAVMDYGFTIAILRRYHEWLHS